MVLVALAPKDPKAGAGTVEGVVCWGVPKLNCIFGVSKGVVAGAATFEDPKYFFGGTFQLRPRNLENKH